MRKPWKSKDHFIISNHVAYKTNGSRSCTVRIVKENYDGKWCKYN